MASPATAQLVYDFMVLLNEVSDVNIDELENDNLYEQVYDWKKRATEIRSRKV